MANVGSQDGSEDVNDFLKRVKQLGEDQDAQDDEASRRYEEQILEGRRQREARRAGTCFQ